MERGASSIEVLLLGAVELRVDGRAVALGGRRQRALLALLALDAGQVVPVDQLVDELWAGEPTDGAETTVRSYVSRLRRSLEGIADVERNDRGYVLRVAGAAVDALEFERLVREGGDWLARGAARRARERLSAGLRLWRGRPFGDVGGEGALAAAADRLEEVRLLALERRIEADLGLGRGAEVVDELEALVGEHPFRERLWQHLMLALYRAGRQADALAAYHRARAALDEQLGIEPGAELRALEAAILRQDVPDVARAPEAPTLPTTLTTFIGRASELESVGRLVSTHRLVTLTGVGGVGKTRLAIEAAREAADSFPDGVWFADLAPLADPDLVRPTVAAVLGIRDQARAAGAGATLAQLGDRELLLVLDNCEHLREACAELAEGLLASAPAARILATSRMILGVPGELDFPVPPLALPEPGGGAEPRSDAVDLFIERARAARPNLPDDAGTREAVGRIVADLDGLPLAIELAAARAKALTVPDIAAGLDDRFRFLVSWRRLASARHRTLAEAMAWSFDLLAEPEQALLERLAVFAGGFDLEAVAAVALHGDAGQALDAIQRLTEASLVSLDPEARGVSRYRLLETVRQYAADRLAAAGRTTEVRAAHARYFATVAETTPVRGADQARGIARLDLELDNLRAAIETAIEAGDRVLERRLAAALWRYWQVRGHLAEAQTRLLAALEGGDGEDTDLYGRVLEGAGSVAWAIGDYAEGKRYAGLLLALGEASGSVAHAHAAHKTLANIALRERDFEASEHHSLRAIALARDLGDEIHLLTAELNHAVLLMDWGRVEPAVEKLEEILDRFIASGHGVGIGLTLLNLGEAAFLLGHDADARRRFEEAREAFAAVGFRAHVGHATQGLAAVEARGGSASVAARLLGRAAAILSEVGAAPEDFNPGMTAGAIATATATLGEEAYEAAYRAGWASERERRPR